jgi:hypothetical protein
MDSSFTTNSGPLKMSFQRCPSGLRVSADGRIVRFDDIMDALKQLDAEAAKRTDYGRLIDRARRIRDLFIVRKRMAV